MAEENDIKNRVSTLETVLGEFIVQTNKSLTRLEKGMSAFKDEMRGFKDEMRDYKEESRAERKALNKKWGDLANKMGTVAEDIAAPNIRAITKSDFQETRIDWYGVRQERRNPQDKSKIKEFDVILATPAYVFVNETKSHPKPEDIPWFQEKCSDFFTYYPEMEGKKLILVYASLALPENMVNQCTNNNILALAMGEENMELQNSEVVNQLKINN